MMTLLATSGVNDLLNKILGIAMPVLIAIAVVAVFKTITDKNNIQRNLFSFYVNDDGQNIKCVTWNETADNLNKVFNKDTKTIEIKYLHKNNKNTDELEYSVREFNIIN